jgi:O-antigen ligase
MTTGSILEHPYSDASWTKITSWAAQIFLWLALLFLPFSHFLVNQTVLLAALFMIISGAYRSKWYRIKQYPSMIWILLFVCMIGISMIYSTAPFYKAFSFFNKYTKLLYIIMLLPICQTSKQRQISLNILVFAIVLATVLAFLYQLNWITYAWVSDWHRVLPIPEGYNGFCINILHASVLQAFAIYLLFVKIIRKCNFMSILLLTFIVVHLVYFNGERTGCIAAILLSAFAIMMHASQSHTPWEKKMMVLMCLIVLLTLTSKTLLLKTNRLFAEFTRYFHSSSGVALTDTALNQSSTLQSNPPRKLGSIGLRLEFSKGSYYLIKERPWFGYGVGSFAFEYNRIKGVLMPGSTILLDPHNAFLAIAVQIGMIGLLLFFVLLFMLWKDIYRLPSFEKLLGMGLGILFMLNSLLNATLLDNTVGYLYVIITAVLLSTLPFSKRTSDS